MNFRRLTSCVLLCLGLICLLTTADAVENPPSRLERFLDASQQKAAAERTSSPRLEPTQRPRSALALQKIDTGPDDQCTVFVDYPYYGLYDWMTGFELYESYMDLLYPLITCDEDYPFQVTHVCMTLALNAPGSLYVQGFVADLDPELSEPTCPYPGDFIRISEEFPGYIPEAGVYILDIDFDPPVEVYGPYFAGIYYGCDMTIFDPGVAIDTVPYLCLDYNDWGYGLYDLADNPYYPFPGSIDLFSIGYNGSGGGNSQPQPHIILPQAQVPLTSGDPVWVAELTDTATYMGCYFEYGSGGSWTGFNADMDGSVTLRDGVNPAERHDGWLVPWYVPGLSEGSYSLRASIIELDSSYASDTTDITYDQYPLQPHFVDREDFVTLCDAESLLVTMAEPNVLAVTFAFRELGSPTTRSLLLLDRNDYGDANGSPLDGNHYWSGEFGEYYSAPALFASLISYWSDMGYSEMLADADSTLTTDELVEHLASMLKVRDDLGAEDDNVLYAVTEYLRQHGGQIKASVDISPDWHWLAGRFLGDRAIVAMAVSQPYGNWVALQQVRADSATIDTIPVSIYDPVGGVLRQGWLLPEGDSLMVGFSGNGSSYHVDLAVALAADIDTTTYRFFASDLDGSNGYGAVLPVDSLTDGSTYLMRVRAHQSGGGIASDYWMMTYDCYPAWIPGDADFSGSINVSDAVYMIAYIFGGGPAPKPVWQSGDSDCNGVINISDPVYLVAYIFGGGSAPCSE
jgi:hypothetical protein